MKHTDLIKISGIVYWCTRNKCNKNINNQKQVKCGLSSKLAMNCAFKETNHKYRLKIWNPITKRADRTRTLNTKDPQEVINERNKFATEIKQHSFLLLKRREKAKPVLFTECGEMFLDYLLDAPDLVAENKTKDRTNAHFKSRKRYIERFIKVCPDVITIYQVDESHTVRYTKWIKSQLNKTGERKFKARSYNDHISGMYEMFKYLIKQKYEIDNVWEGITSEVEERDPQIMTNDDFILFISVITPQNGKTTQGSNKKKINRYKPWLKTAYTLGLLSGERGDGLLYMDWGWVNFEGLYIKVPNYKKDRDGNRITKHYHYVGITKDLAELLIKLEPKDSGYIIAPGVENRETLKSYYSKSFTHFWRVTGINKHVTAYSLRRTYDTRMRILIPDQYESIGIHTKQVSDAHYFDKKEAVKILGNETLIPELNIKEL